MTTIEVAKELNKSLLTIKRWIYSGYLKATKIGGDWYIPESEIKRLKGE
jgi:putative resolvase